MSEQQECRHGLRPMPAEPGGARHGLPPMHLQPVMVNPGPSTDNPPVGGRGTLHVAADGAVDLVLEYAVMFDRPAENIVIRLTSAQVAALCASRIRTGAYGITLDRPLNPPPVRDYVVASPRL